ncbi:MAG: hypothetical protein ACI9QD_001010 [Thermoproteota archaeon]|jgi:uncharacterized protein (DUF1499 family)
MLKSSILFMLITFSSNLLALEDFNLCPDKPNCVSSHKEEHKDRYIKPLKIKKISDFEKVFKFIKGHTDIKIVRKKSEFFQVIYKTKWLRFKDDVYFELDKVNNLIHVRSSSRVGHYDFGANRSRIERIRKLLKLK